MIDYDSKYDIRLAGLDDIDDIMNFIDTYWRKGHILARDKELFRYEHVDGDKVTFLLAVDRETHSIEGILGYIPASKDADMLDIWTGIWQVKDHVLPLLGLEMYKRLAGMVGARSLLGVGDNPNTTGRILKKLTKDFNTWKMDHYYMPARKQEYSIAVISQFPEGSDNAKVPVTDTVEFSDIDKVGSFINLSKYTGFPHKDLWYIRHRFFEHPVYDYRVVGLSSGDNRALLCYRIQEHDGAKAVRIVDYIGDRECFAGLKGFFKKLLDETGAEYADFYVAGFEPAYIESAGFTVLTDDDANIIPNFFNPFEQRNIDIYVSGNIPEGLFTKADGDQDRPN